MTYMQAVYSILIGSAACVAVGCEREASSPAAAGPVAPAQAGRGGDDKMRIQLNLGKEGSVDIEKNAEGSN